MGNRDFEERLMDVAQILLLVLAVVFATSFTVFAITQMYFLFFPK